MNCLYAIALRHPASDRSFIVMLTVDANHDAEALEADGHIDTARTNAALAASGEIKTEEFELSEAIYLCETDDDVDCVRPGTPPLHKRRTRPDRATAEP